MKKIKKSKVIKMLLLITTISIVAILITVTMKKQKNEIEQEETKQEEIKENEKMQEIKETKEVLINPGKGYTLKSKHTDEYDNIIAVGYKRYDWNEIEPEEGKYNWNLIDEDIKYYEDKGKKYAFGIMNANTSTDGQYVTPKWVFDAGAKSRTIEVKFWQDSEKHTQTIPIWTDEVFLNKMNNFIKELAKRYDRNKNIAYIDIRSYGNWGEQHTGEIGGESLTAKQLQDLYIEPYINNFKKTLLVNVWGNEKYNDTYKWAIENGVSIRRDGIFKYSEGTECAMAYGKLPSIFEYTGDYNWMKSNGIWSQDKLLKYIENRKTFLPGIRFQNV